MTMQRINTHSAGGPDVLYLETTATLLSHKISMISG